MNSTVFSVRRVAMAALSLIAGVAHASAPPTLTADGSALGFSLTTVVSGFGPSDSSSYDVLGSAVNSDGNIVVNVSRLGKNFVFKNIDGQTQADALTSSSFSGFASALAYANGSVWASAYGGHLVKLKNDGSIDQVYNNIPASQGLWTNPANGHLIAGNPLYDIDVSGATPTYTLITSSFSADGVTVSPDGKFAYGSYGTIVDLTTKTIVSPGFGSVSGADGMGVISAPGNAGLDGDLIVNTTSGKIVLVDHVTFAQTIIASGGGYGDYTSPDRTTGTLLVSSSNNLLRLSCGKGCGIGLPPPPPPTVPEPEVMGLALAGLATLGFIRRRKGDRSASMR